MGTHYNGLYGEVPPDRGTFYRLEVCIGLGFYVLEYRKINVNGVKQATIGLNLDLLLIRFEGWENSSFRYQKGLSKCLEQTHLTADSSKRFTWFLK